MYIHTYYIICTPASCTVLRIYGVLRSLLLSNKHARAKMKVFKLRWRTARRFSHSGELYRMRDESGDVHDADRPTRDDPDQTLFTVGTLLNSILILLLMFDIVCSTYFSLVIYSCLETNNCRTPVADQRSETYKKKKRHSPTFYKRPFRRFCRALPSG